MLQTHNLALQCLVCLVLAALLCLEADAGNDSSTLSRWLAREPVEDLRTLLLQHPRYQDRTLAIEAERTDRLSAAIVQVLQANLASHYHPPQHGGQLPDGRTASIDSLQCRHAVPEYRLLVTIQDAAYGHAMVQLRLIASDDNDTLQHWSWRGRLTSAEREYLGQPSAVTLNTASPGNPWPADANTRAAAELARHLVCSLRPYTAGHTALDWQLDPALPPALADTVRTAQHYVGAYRELSLMPGAGDYRIETRTATLQSGVWQLWLVAVPTDPDLPAHEAVTYLAADPALLTTSTGAGQVASTLPPIPSDPLSPRSLQVELLGMTRVERARGADLNLRLRLANQGPVPLAYGLRTSAGYFEDCIGQRQFYRHRQFARATGQLAVGESVIRTLSVRGLPHGPGAGNQPGACAAFSDLGPFQDFRHHGEQVIEYLRPQHDRSQS